jgi:hypothetical protein
MSIPYEGEGTTGPGLTGISTSAPGIVGTSDSGPGIVGASGLAVLGASAATGEDGVLGLSGTGASSAPPARVQLSELFGASDFFSSSSLNPR